MSVQVNSFLAVMITFYLIIEIFSTQKEYALRI